MISTRGAVLVAAFMAVPLPAQASLTGRLHRFLDRTGFPTHGDFIEAVTPIVERLALRGIDFPVAATSPGFTYRFNFELGVPERSTESFGPVFAERAETVGRHRLDLGIAYLYADLTDFDGDDFGRQIVTRGKRTAPDILGLTFRGSFVGEKFSLTNHVVSVSATYGLTDSWDVNVLQSVVENSLVLGGVASARVSTPERTEPPTTQRVVFDASAFGVGDTFVRTKYRLSEGGLADVAAALTLRLPAGNQKDLHGLGDTVVAPTMALSRTFGPHEAHCNLGLELNANDAERNRARYAVGGSVRPFERLGFLFDVIGSSSFADDDFEILAPAGRVFPGQAFGTNELIKTKSATKIVAFVPRSDVVDLAVGIKVNPFGALVGFASAIVPLTRDGLRAEVIPTVGAETSF